MNGRALLAEVVSAGSCSHPVRLRGSTVNLITGEVRDAALKVPCKDRRAVICPACSDLYKADAWILVSTGLVGGKGLPSTVDSHPRLFVTLTAPGFGPVHTIGSAGRCRRGRARCSHGAPTWCDVIHREEDPLLGHPLCVECFDYEAAVLWNAVVSRLWNATIIRLRQSVATAAGVPTARARGRKGGRPTVMTPEKTTMARELYDSKKYTVESIAKELGVSRKTVYRHLNKAV